MAKYFIGTTAEGVELLKFAVSNLLYDIELGHFGEDDYDQDHTEDYVVRNLEALMTHLNDLLEDE